MKHREPPEHARRTAGSQLKTVLEFRTGSIAARSNVTITGTRFYILPSRQLANGGPGGGNVQLHKSNPSTTAAPGFFELQEWQMCGDMANPGP